ncbi:MAG: Hpt domain-containing protein, partial [Bacteroidota bacterium]
MQEKYEQLAPRFQFLRLDLQGHLLASCETLLPLKTLEGSIFQYFSALGTRAKLFQRLENKETLRLYDEVLRLNNVRLTVDLAITLQTREQIILLEVLIEDRTDFYDRMREQEAKRNQQHAGQRLELINEILELKQRQATYETRHEAIRRAAFGEFWVLWSERTTPLLRLLSLSEHEASSSWLEMQKLLLEAHLNKNLHTQTEVFSPTRILRSFWKIWQDWNAIMGFQTAWETTEPDWVRGDRREWQLLLMAVFSELMRQRIPLKSFQTHWRNSQQQLECSWEGDFPEKLNFCTEWREVSPIWQKSQQKIQLSFNVTLVSDKPALVKKVGLLLTPDSHSHKIASWIESEGIEVAWLKPDSKIEVDLCITEKTKNTYLSASRTWELTSNQKPISRDSLFIHLHAQNEEKTMIPSQEIDLSYIREIVDDQPEMMLNLLGILENNLKDYPVKMQEEWESGDLHALRETAHKFKSSTAYTNLTAFNQALNDLEKSEEEGKTTEEIKELLDAIIVT